MSTEQNVNKKAPLSNWFNVLVYPLTIEKGLEKIFQHEINNEK